MKRTLFISILNMLCLIFALGQEQESENSKEFKTLFNTQEIRVSGMGGPIMNFSAIDGEFAHYMGGGGGILINDFFFGGFGVGKTNKITPPSGQNDLEFGYGGLWFGYSFLGNMPIHPSIHLKTGWGGASIVDNFDIIEEDNSIFVLAPTAEIELNFSKFFRMAFGVNYSLVSGVDLTGYSDKDFSGLGGNISFKFGWFN